MRLKLVHIEVSKNDSDRVTHLLFYKNHYALIKKLIVFLGDDHRTFICRSCLNSYTSENMLMLHKPECENFDITTNRTSMESQIQWKKHFHKNPLYFRTYAVFEADNEIDKSSLGNKTTIIYRQNPVNNGCRIVSELEDLLQDGYYESASGYDNVNWFVNVVTKLEDKMAFYFKITKKDIIMMEENEEHLKNNNVCLFCEKIFKSDKVRDHCHLTGKYRGPADSKCNINVTQDKSNIIPFFFHNFGNYDCHLFFKKLVDRKNDKVKFDIIPETNDEYISVTYDCFRFIDTCRFLSMSLDGLVKFLNQDVFRILKKNFLTNGNI